MNIALFILWTACGAFYAYLLFELIEKGRPLRRRLLALLIVIGFLLLAVNRLLQLGL